MKWWTRLRLKKELAPLNPDIFYNHPECAYAYNRDFNGVKDADVLVFIADDKPRAYNGANVELGIALSDLKPCYVIGNLENSALYYRVARCLDIDDLLTSLKIVNEAKETWK